MADVFISYSRKDREFVRRLHQAMEGQGRDAYMDVEDIPAASRWRQEIAAAIEGADALVFVVSPDSAVSEGCRQELDHALAHHKRIIPAVCRETAPQETPEALRELNWISCRAQDDFTAATTSLLKALDTDLDWVKAHTRLLTRAIDWDGHGRDRSRVLRGTDLKEAESWLAKSGDKEPKPTELQGAYILTSRQAESRRKNSFTALACTVALVLAGIAVYAVMQRHTAVHQARIALSRQLAAQAGSLLDSKLDLAILLSLEAWRVENTVEAKSALYTSLFKDFRLQSLLHGIDEPVACVAFSPDGRTLATASGDNPGLPENQIILWDMASRRPKGPPLPGKVGAYPQIAFSPDGKTLAATGQGAAEIFLWDTTTKQSLNPPLKSREREVTKLAFSPDGASLATGLVPEGILLWDFQSRQWCIQPLQGLPKWPRTVAYNFNGQLLAVGHTDNLKHSDYNIITLWNLSTGELLGSLQREFERHPHPLAFNPAGTFLASGGAADRIILWDVRTHKPLEHPFLPYKGTLDLLSFSPDGKILAGATSDGTYLWDPVTPGNPIHLKFKVTSINSLSFSPDSKTLALGTYGVSSGNRVGNLMLWEADVWPGGFIFGKAQEPVYLKDILRQAKLMHNSDGSSISLDGKIWAVFDKQAKTIKLFDADTEKLLGSPIADQLEVKAFCFSPDSRILAAGYADNMVRLWDVHSHKPLGPPLQGHDSEVSSLAFSPDGSILTSGSWGTSPTILLWDVKTGKSLGPPL